MDHLSRASQAGKQAAADIRPTHGLRIPRAEYEFRPIWQPPPSKEEFRRLVKERNRQSFVCFGKKEGTYFEDPRAKRMVPKVLDTWTQGRIDTPDRTFAKSPSTIRYRAHSEPFPEPHDGLCHEFHQEWLSRHRLERDQRIHPVYHALERVRRAQEQLDSHAQKRQLARDLLSRREAMDLPEFSSNVKRGLAKVKIAVASTRAFRLAKNTDVADMEERDRVLLERAKSAPALALNPPKLECTVKHGRQWACQDQCCRSSQEIGRAHV